MGDQGERSPQSFLVNNFSFLQTAAKTRQSVRFQVSRGLVMVIGLMGVQFGL